MRLITVSSVLLNVLSSACTITGREELEPVSEVEAEYRASLVDVPCPNEDEDTASARRAIAHVRAIAGLPMPRCDQAAATAAAAHCRYIEANGGALTHVQDPRGAGYTGKTFEDRLAAASFAESPAGEVMATLTRAASITGPRGYLNSVYHRSFFLRSETTSFGYGATSSCSTIDFGRAHDTRAVADITVVWPPDGARSVPYEFHAARETPNPIPRSEIVGSPVSLIRGSSFVKVTASLSGPGGEIATTSLTHQTDKNHLVRQGEVHLIPLAPLAPLTTYRARFVLTEAGVTAPKTIETTFTTSAH